MNFFSTFLLKCLEVIKKAVSLQRFREIRHTKFTEVMKGRLAQLVQSICLTSRGSAVRIRQRPHEQKSPMRLITKEIIIGYELMRFASARPFLSNGPYLSLFKCK